MALKYENQVSGRKVTVLEPDELEEKLKTVKRRGRPLDPKRILLAKKRRERTIQKMNDSWKWARTGVTSQKRRSNGGGKGGGQSGDQGDGGQES